MWLFLSLFAHSLLAICHFSSTLEEVSVRANLVLPQKKFVNEIAAVDDADREELDAEYDSLCAQVVRGRM